MKISTTIGLMGIILALFVVGLVVPAFAQDAPFCYPIADISRVESGYGSVPVGEELTVSVWVGANTLNGADSATVTVTSTRPEDTITPLDSTFDCTSPATFTITSSTPGQSYLQIKANGEWVSAGRAIEFFGPYPDGTLIRPRHFSDVFIIKDGKKWIIPSLAAMERFGFDWLDVQEVPQANELAYSLGGMYVEDGTLLRETGGSDVWIIKIVGGKRYKRVILSPHVFEAYGHLHWEDILDVSPYALDEFTTSDLVRAEGDTRIFKLSPRGDAGDRQWVRSSDAFTRNGFDWDSVFIINTVDRDAYADGADIE